MRPIELLSPCGDMERLKYAVSFGADAVYLGGSAYGMRAGAKNFSMKELNEAVSYAHGRGVKVYLTCNTLPRNGEIKELPAYLKEAAAAGVDAFIIADMGVLQIAKRVAPQVEVHISTQAGVVNYASAGAFYDLGASRVVLARELSFEDIREIRGTVDPKLELEAFVHGAMCMSFSGRCLLSEYLVGRDANRGDCAQPCRWKYHLMEETRPGKFFPVEEGTDGTHILNSKDLCMLAHIAKLHAAGIDSFKIEGRNKSAYYTAITTYAYRSAIDGYLKHPFPDYIPEAWILEEMEKVSHREYTTGFYFGPIEKGQVYETAGYLRSWDVAAIARSYDGERLAVSQRNRFYEGDELEAVEPGRPPYTVVVSDLRDGEGEPIAAANRAAMNASFLCSVPVAKDALLRRRRTED